MQRTEGRPEVPIARVGYATAAPQIGAIERSVRHFGHHIIPTCCRTHPTLTPRHSDGQSAPACIGRLRDQHARVSSTAHVEYDLAEHPARLEDPVRGRGVSEW